MTETKTIEEAVMKYSNIEQAKNNTHYIKITVGETTFTVFHENKEALEAMKASAPVYSKVQVKLSKNGKYWNYEPKSWVVLEKATPSQTPPAGPSGSMNSSDYWKERYDLEKARHERLERNDPAYMYKDIVVAVIGAVKIDISDEDKIAKQTATINSVAKDFYEACKVIAEEANNKKENNEDDPVQDARDNDII